MGFHVIHMHTFEFSIKLIHKVKTEIAGKFVGLYTEFLNKSACPFRLSSTVMMMLENVLNCFKQQASSILMLTLLMRIKLPTELCSNCKQCQLYQIQPANLVTPQLSSN